MTHTSYMTQDTMTRHTDAGLVASPLMATATGMLAEGLVRVAVAVGVETGEVDAAAALGKLTAI